MQLYHGFETIERNADSKVVLTIGNFDGVHLGHQVIIRLAIERAKKLGTQTWALTFKPHPQIALRPEKSLPLLCTYAQKIELLGGLGLDAVIEQPFSREFSTLTPEQFFNEVIRDAARAQVVVVGYDFAFGKGRAGSLEALKAFCDQSQIELHVVPQQSFAGSVASSSKIRSLLQEGNLEGARALLGRQFFYRGIVEKGDARGRKIGFPTANFRPEASQLLLPLGVYATRSRTFGLKSTAAQRELMQSVTYIGLRPTFYSQKGETAVIVETHLLDRTMDLYGEALEVEFVQRIRGDLKFPSVDSLTLQIAKDIEATRAILKSSS